MPNSLRSSCYIIWGGLLWVSRLAPFPFSHSLRCVLLCLVYIIYSPLLQFFVLRDYARESLSLRWRSWMTGYYMERYLTDRTFYKIQSQSIIDNPDQRIVDDLSSFTATALSFSLTLFSTFVDLVSFSNILFGIYPPLFIILLVYSIGGTAISIFLGKVISLCLLFFFFYIYTQTRRRRNGFLHHNSSVLFFFLFYRVLLFSTSCKRRKKLIFVTDL